jgi:regulator of protease activity HflC (stomatin/prohibitin superfamily)
MSQIPGDESQDLNAEPEQPRRGASAQFNVAETSNQQAALRQAMDPANESLAEALRLSYRVLQVAILVLVVVFCFSGFQSVSEGQTGVKTVFGAIVGEPGQEQVRPGLQPFWPYPIGEVVLVDQKRVVELRREFWPKLKPGQTTIEQATQTADKADLLRPAMDSGTVITGDGDLAHVQVTAEYSVDDAVRLLGELDPASADVLVRSVLMQATVQTAAQFTLTELLESRDQPAQALRTLAQESLDRLKCGIQLTSVTIPQKIAPLAVRNIFQKVQEARERGKTLVEQAQQDANRTLVGIAGPENGVLLALIGDYESQLTRGDIVAADAAMDRIGAALEGPTAAGEVSQIIARAQAHQSALSSHLANEARRLKGLSGSFRDNPTQLVRQLWLDALRETLDNSLVEVFSLGSGATGVKLAITSSPDIMQERRQSEIDVRKRQNALETAGGRSVELGTRLIMDGKPGRKLSQDASKGFGRD